MSIIDIQHFSIHPIHPVSFTHTHTHTHTHTTKMSTPVRHLPSTCLHLHKFNLTKLSKHYTRLLTLWPKDALRPTLPFTRAIEHRAKPYGVKPLTPIPQEAAASQVPVSVSPQIENAQVNALYTLLENRYSKKYALSAEMFRPASAPEHYEKLMEEIERAPGKTWWQAKVDEWKMKIRWS